jgi:hypothetical protein
VAEATAPLALAATLDAAPEADDATPEADDDATEAADDDDETAPDALEAEADIEAAMAGTRTLSITAGGHKRGCSELENEGKAHRG